MKFACQIQLFLLFPLFFAGGSVGFAANHTPEPAASVVTDSLVSKPKKQLWHGWEDWRFLMVPTVAYAPETDWAFGAAGAYYFNLPNEKKVSDLNFDGSYTLLHQWAVNVAADLYFGGKRAWQLTLRGNYSSMPDFYYGQGNESFNLLEQRISYKSQKAVLNAMGQVSLGRHWLVGGQVVLQYAKTQFPAQSPEIVGANVPTFLVGLGVVATYDTRDCLYYPMHGLFFKTVFTHYESALNTAFRTERWSLDFRHFVPLYKELVLAYRVYADMAFGRQVPFFLLPTLGGQDMLRGFNRGKYTDKFALGLQGELRIPVWRFIRLAVFAEMGNVYNWQSWHFSGPKIGYGIGLRLAVNKAKANIRFDVARTTENHDLGLNGWNFYLTLKEAF